MACHRIATAPAGAANWILNAETFSLGQRFVVTGHLDLASVVDALLSTATAAGYPERRAAAVIQSALGASRRSEAP